MKKRILLVVKTIMAIFTIIIVVALARRGLRITLVKFDLPMAIMSLITISFLFMVPWLSRAVFYPIIIVSETMSFYYIIVFSRSAGIGIGNAVTGSAMSLLLVITIAETFRYSLTRLKMINKKLTIERERANSATKRKDIFLAKMSHELRTPLNGIKGITELLLEDAQCSDKKNYLTMISESAETLQFLIDDLLDLSTIENDKITLNNKFFQLKPFLESIGRHFDFVAKERGVVLEVIIPDSVEKYLCMDNLRLKQIYFNLLSNAIKYTNSGGRVSFKAEIKKGEADGELFVVEVLDNGIGITEPDLAKIFNSFFRSEENYNNQTSGIGLGLFIVKHLVELLSGTIEVQSEFGKGSTFKVSIPIIEGSETCDANCLKQEQISVPEIKILIAEDNKVNAFFITSLLEKHGHKLTLVENGVDAVKKCSTEEYDLVLMDIQMPEMSGLQAVQVIRDEEKETHKKQKIIIAITAYASDNEKKAIEQSGFNYYISKPIDSAKLLSLIQQSFKNVSETP